MMWNSLLLSFAFILTLSIFGVFSKMNNACNSFDDYFTLLTNKKCSYQEDLSLNTTQLIHKYAGEVETHKVTTEDGYILTMYRMPKPNAKKVIFLQHPLLVDGHIWVAFNDSLALFLWHQGYEVWIANMRGTRYSKGHVSFSYLDSPYWKWSIHEIGVFDVSAQVKLINNITNAKVTFIGHSLGTTAGLIYGAIRPNEAKELIDQFVFMGTTAIYKYSKNPFIVVAKFLPLMKILVNLLDLNSVFFFLPILVPFSNVLFRTIPFAVPLLHWTVNFVGGLSDVTDPSELNADVAEILQTFSSFSGLHIFQLIQSKTRFEAYDYGYDKDNIQAYGSAKPPIYRLNQFPVPISFFSAENDILTPIKDTEYIINELLPKNLKTTHKIIKGMNHFDFQIAKNKNRLFFDEIIKNLEINDIKCNS